MFESLFQNMFAKTLNHNDDDEGIEYIDFESRLRDRNTVIGIFKYF